jgi:hypothetical protein
MINKKEKYQKKKYYKRGSKIDINILIHPNTALSKVFIHNKITAKKHKFARRGIYTTA